MKFNEDIFKIMKPQFRILGLLFLFIFLVHSVAIAQNDHIRFSRLTINDGLSLSSVYTIFQDSKGFMWFGTEDGLNKYDGKEFQIFRPDPVNANSLGYKWIELIYEDSRGHLWFGSKGGLTAFDPEKELFLQFNTYEGEHRLTGDTITSLHEDSSNQLWVGTTSGINRIDIKKSTVTKSELHGIQILTIRQFQEEIWVGTNRGLYIKTDKEESFQAIDGNHVGMTDLSVYSIAEDKEGDIWFGIGNVLIESSKSGAPAKKEKTLINHGQVLDQIENLIVDNNNDLWVSCSGGLFKYNTKNKQIASVVKSIDISHSLAINPIKSIHLDKHNNLWYGTFGEGVNRIDIYTGRFNKLRNNPGDLQSLSENSINSIFEDEGGNIWFGTFGAGINIYKPEAHKFGFMSHQPFNPNSLSSNFIWSIMECDNEKLWIGTNDEGLNIYDPVTDKYAIFKHEPDDPYSISHSSVRKVFEDSKKRIWVGTDGGGLNRFDPKTGRFIYYKNIPGDTSSISGNSVRVIYEDLKNRLWIGTRTGLNLFDPERETFKRFTHDDQDNTSISNDFVYSTIHHDKNGYLWIGTYGGGLNQLNLATGKFKKYFNEPANPESISDNIVFSIHEDSGGILWVGTNSGLNRFDPDSENFKRFGMHEGLPNEVIYGILADDRNNLWLSTNRGICRFSLDNYSTKNFTTNDGLQSNEFNGGAFHRGKSGQMYFGGVYGLNIIDPDLDYIDGNKSQVVFTNLEILGNKVITISDSAGMKNRIRRVGDKYYLSKNISYADEIILDYQHRFFSIEYAALNSTNTDNLRFQYKMEGLDNKWNDVGDRDFIAFANTQPGEYTLKIKTSNVDGFEGLSPAVLHIIITPPFWKTWWFYLLEAIVLLVLLVFIYKYLLKIRTNRLLRVQNEKIFQSNQMLTESENNLKQLNATKDKFFSIISHDLKNPFTSLLSISELMSEDYENLEEEDKVQGIQRVHDSAKRIYNLLENLLTWSRAQTGRISYSPVHLNLSEVIVECISLHAEFAENKGIYLETTNSENVQVYCDREMINTVIRNLLNNAIKFSSEGKVVRVEAEDIVTAWKISIIDQGIGIAKENLDRIFRIETKFRTEGTMGEKGTGLGLLLCKEFVEKNKGHISIVSKEGQGSTFSFTLPKSGSFVE